MVVKTLVKIGNLIVKFDFKKRVSFEIYIRFGKILYKTAIMIKINKPTKKYLIIVI
jgi:uncharacterized protein (DUF1919 family)